ncbi:hypothetical protein QMN25_27280, partial [Klebsiella pneumoniae]
SAQIREILINESAWEEMTCLFALSLDLHVSQHNPQAVNVIQGVNDYTMEMSIVEVQGGYLLSGAVKGIPQARLRVSAKFIGELV